MKLYVLALALSTLFFSLNLLVFPFLRSFFLDFSAAFHKNYVFLLCNGILVFIVVNSGGSGGFSEDVVESENERRGGEKRETAMEAGEAEEIDGDEEEIERKDEDCKKEIETAKEEEEEEEEEEMGGAEELQETEMAKEEEEEMELHRKCDEFIRRMRETMIYESKQLTIVDRSLSTEWKY